jgi:hypothetical protein
MSHDHLARSGREQLRAHLRGVARLRAAFPGQAGGAQQPVHRRLRAQVDALIEQRRPDLRHGPVAKPWAAQHGQDLLLLGSAQRVHRRGPPDRGRG